MKLHELRPLTVLLLPLGVKAEEQAPETERLQVKDTRVRMPVRVAEYVPDSKADRSRFTDVSLREALITSSQPYMQS